MEKPHKPILKFMVENTLMKQSAIALILVWLGTVGCSGLSDPEYLDNKKTNDEGVIWLSRIDTTDVVTLDDLLKLDEKFEQAYSRSNSRTIHDITSVKGEDGSVLMYVVNYNENGGFRIYSGRKDCEPLLAYSDDGYFDLESVEQSGVSNWINDLKRYIGLSEEVDDDIRFRNRFEWSTMLGLSERIYTDKSRSVDFNDYKRQIEKELMEFSRQGYMIYPLSDFINGSNNPPIVGVSTPPEYLVRQISNISNKEVLEDSYVIYKTSKRESDSSKQKLMSTKWGQGTLYNVPNFVWFVEPDLGCSVVALGQILAYKHYLTGYDYDRMLATNPDNNEISRFLYDIGVKIGVPYDLGLSGASIGDVAKALEKWNLAYNYYDFFNKAQIHSSIDSHIPVYIRGDEGDNKEGHAWVIDGYNHVIAESDCMVLLLNQYGEDVIGESIFWLYDQSHSVIYERDYYHCNWGDYGQKDGFFMQGKFSCGFGELNEGNRVLTNIRKR